MTEEIIKRFRKKYDNGGFEIQWDKTGETNCDFGFDRDKFEQFILQELSKAKDEVKAELQEKVEGMEKKCNMWHANNEDCDNCSFNQALSEVLKLLT